MTHATRIVAVAVLVALVLLNVSCEVQTPEIDALRARAEQGDVEAQNNLGLMYDNGEGVPQDYAEVVRWYRLAAEQGLASAQFNLGLMYDTGYGVPEDDAEAMRWHRLAADQGQAQAQ
jgi:TPR repeat protein